LVSGVIDLTHQHIGNFKIKYLGEFESIFEKALARVSGAHKKLFVMEKTVFENLVTQSLSREIVVSLFIPSLKITHFSYVHHMTDHTLCSTVRRAFVIKLFGDIQ
jgi:hypothetical protein